MYTELEKLLRRKPFTPFQIFMSDGTKIPVTHPEAALLTKLWVYVTTDGGRTTQHIYVLHITRIETQAEPIVTAND
jgi:hypothetical protein